MKLAHFMQYMNIAFAQSDKVAVSTFKYQVENNRPVFCVDKNGGDMFALFHCAGHEFGEFFAVHIEPEWDSEIGPAYSPDMVDDGLVMTGIASLMHVEWFDDYNTAVTEILEWVRKTL